MKKQENNKKNLIYVTPFFPYPPNDGGKIRPFNKLKYLAPYYRIYLYSFYDEKDDISSGVQGLNKFCEDIHLFKLEKKMKMDISDF